jgi:hypothetical protein
MGPEKLEKVLEKLATSEKPQSLSARKARAPPFISRRLAQRPECCSHLGGKQRRLFPSSEMTALVELCNK